MEVRTRQTLNLTRSLQDSLKPGERFIELRCIEPKENRYKTYILTLGNNGSEWFVRAFWGRIGYRAQAQMKYVGTRARAEQTFKMWTTKKLKPHGTGQYEIYIDSTGQVGARVTHPADMLDALEISNALDMSQAILETDGESTFIRFLEI